MGQKIFETISPVLIKPQAGYEFGSEMGGLRVGADVGYFALVASDEDSEFPNFDGADILLGANVDPSRTNLWTAEAGVTYKNNLVFYSGGLGLGVQLKNNDPDNTDLSAGLAVNGTAGLLMDVLFLKGKLEIHPKAENVITVGAYFGFDLINGLTALALVLK